MEMRATIILLFFSVWLHGQKDTALPVIITMEDNMNDQVYTVVDEQPSFGETEDDLLIYFQEKSKFSIVKREKKVSGHSVYVNIIIDRNGKVIEHKIIKGVNTELDKETKRLMENMPLWKPGILRGKPVKVSKTIEVRYKE